MDHLKVETYIPEEYVPGLRDALSSGGYLREGAYDSVMAMQKVTGCWRPLEGSSPFTGTPGKLTTADEIKVEFRCRASDMRDVERVIRSVHPYEVPVINFISLVE